MTAADVTLTEAEREALTAAFQSSSRSPDHLAFLATPAVERILADRLAAVQAEAEIAGQMKHITAEMVRGDQPLEAKEEMIADLRARLSHVEAERDAWQGRAAKNREGWKQMLHRAESAGRRLAEAWDEGWEYGGAVGDRPKSDNPYRARADALTTDTAGGA